MVDIDVTTIYYAMGTYRMVRGRTGPPLVASCVQRIGYAYGIGHGIASRHGTARHGPAPYGVARATGAAFIRACCNASRDRYRLGYRSRVTYLHQLQFINYCTYSIAARACTAHHVRY